MKLNNENKTLIEIFWNDNTKVSSNTKDILKLKVRSKNHDPHAKYLLDMTQTKLYIKFLSESLLPFNISQRSFEKYKPWYVKINKQRVSCCKIHMQFKYYYDVF